MTTTDLKEIRDAYANAVPRFSDSKYKLYTYIPIAIIAIIGFILFMTRDFWIKHDAVVIRLNPTKVESDKNREYYFDTEGHLKNPKIRDVVSIWHKSWKSNGHSLKPQNNIVPFLGLSLFGASILLAGVVSIHDVQMFIQYDRVTVTHGTSLRSVPP